MRRLLASLALWPVLLAAFGPGARATSVVFEPPMPVHSLRPLTYHADAVVVAEPLDPTNPVRFKVREVLRGKALRVGATFALPDGPHRLRSFDPPALPREGPRARVVEQALLYLNAPGRGGKLDLVPSGVRFHTEDGRVLVPRLQGSRGAREYVMVERPGSDWAALLAQARADAAALERLYAVKALARPDARVRGLLDWVEHHRRDFGGPLQGKAGESPFAGWGSMEGLAFRWALAAGTPAECWSAVRLHAELEHGSTPVLPPGCSLLSPAGRALLLRVARDEQALPGDRARALALLSDPFTLWPDDRPTAAATKSEQAGLLEALAPLVRAKDAHVRAAAARAVRRISSPEAPLPTLPPPGPRVESKPAVEAVVAAYKEERNAHARDDLAEAVAVLAPARWKELSGNPPGVVALLLDSAVQDGQLVFWLHLRTPGPRVHERPTVVLQRISAIGLPLETKKVPLPVDNPLDVRGGRDPNEPPAVVGWAAGWDGWGPLMVELPLGKLTPGYWKVTVEGTAGKEKLRWVSEPKRFTVAAPKGPGRRDRPIGSVVW